MRILHVSSEASWRGGEQQIAYLIQESRDRGVEIELIVRDGSAFQHFAQEQNFKNSACSFSGLSLIAGARLLKKASNEVDLIHVHSGKGHDVLAFAYLLGMKRPSILSRRVDFEAKKNPWAEWKYNHPGIKRVLCVSDAIAAMMQRALKSPEKALTVHSGVDLERYNGIQRKGVLHSLLGLSPETRLVGVVAALAPHKDLFTFIDTCAMLAQQDDSLRYVIIGEGALRKELEEHVERKGLSEKLFMLGFMLNALELLPDLDVFLLTSKTEGLGTSIIDAMASGVPVVATHAGGIPELVVHEKTGLLADIGDENSLAKNVIRLLSSAELCERLTLAARKHIQDFSFQITASRTIEIYEEVLREEGR